LNLSDSRLLVFEPELRKNFLPLTYMRLGASFLFGTGTLLDQIEANLAVKTTDLLVPSYLKAYSEKLYPEVKVNQPISSCIAVSSFVSHRVEVWKFIINALKTDERFLYMDHTGNPVFGKFDEIDSSKLKLDKIVRLNSSRAKVSVKPLPGEISEIALLHYPWELVQSNSERIDLDYSRARFSSDAFSSKKKNDLEIHGNKVAIADSAQVERFVTIDSRKGPVIIDEEAEVQSFTHMTGPCYLGKRAKIKSAKIREGTTVGESSKIAGEVEASIISEFSNKSHDGFLGHSIIGSWVNLGALTTCSDLKNTYGKIRVKLGRKLVDTGQIKVGVFLADMSKTAIGVLLTSGVKIGVGSQVFGAVSEDVPSFTLYGKGMGARSSEALLDSALATQKRMMERRNLAMSKTLESLIRSVYKMTRGERAFQRVSKARFKLL
jgi:UDP-N-acetylglucosamine diphosphorylase / glucose-1-phosphate thymidylyltransferase / UDP-N-acetylgalactosamine diphosphorylase / glucosamine-1-phosphate N-acetyltransferase / galactosamine-1-phosphate N-acetyltransferase